MKINIPPEFSIGKRLKGKVVLRIDPKNAIAYYNRGFNHGALGSYQNAIKDYTSAITLNPSYVEAYVNRAISLLKMERNTEALNDFNQAIQLSPGNTFFYFLFVRP